MISDNNSLSGKAATLKTTFSRETSIGIEIKADPAVLWALLTNAPDYPRWNSTVIAIDGNIALWETIKLKSILDPKRTFKLKVKEFEPAKRLVWGDAQGNRVYELNDNGNGTVSERQDPAGVRSATFRRCDRAGANWTCRYRRGASNWIPEDCQERYHGRISFDRWRRGRRVPRSSSE